MSFSHAPIVSVAWYSEDMKSDFSARVYKVVSVIPKGKVLTYGQVAKLAGSSGAA
ncbi:MAG TPA: MGMT family protein, partial [Candidatus Paceibacterota bacterium]